MVKQTEHGASVLTRILSLLKSFLEILKNLRRAYNRRMKRHYSATAVALTATAVCFLAAVILLFVPRYIGVADDGSLNTVLQHAGLKYQAADSKQPVGAYFVKTYQRAAPAAGGGFSTHLILIRLAMGLDSLFTPDNMFDVRFLALIYLCLYLPAVWLLVKQAALRAQYASEGTVIGAAAVLLFSDVSYLAYFNSLYPQAVWLIGLLYCCGLCLSLQMPGRADTAKLALLSIFGAGLTLCEQHCAVLGFVLAVFCLRQIGMDHARRPTRVAAVLSAAVLIVAGCGTLIGGSSRFSQDSKLNSMTTGVLLESSNPEKTLAEFGIDARFETLTDISSYSAYPLVKADNSELKRGFYDRYSTPRLMLYYARHPASMGMLLELGVKSAFHVRSDYCGNYESSAGMPARSRTPLFALASNFRMRSAPQTLGYLLVVAITYSMLLSKWSIRRLPRQTRTVALNTFWAVMAAGLLHMAYIVLRSGTAELSRYCLIFSVCIDLFSLLAAAEILHRLNVLETEEGEK
ncbi:MAG: hypothetical protein LKJ17_09060 [Oscillospiraceae bacterium]|jgi:hypothetical protein|nr:hypothetical protein [Oscillospiraceae bacterium]